MIAGLFETHLKVADLKRSEHFYGEVLGLELAHRDETRPITFYWLGGRGEAMLGLWEEAPENIQRQHFAFRSTVPEVLRAPAWLRERAHTAQFPERRHGSADGVCVDACHRHLLH
ncbi:VOC family protein [Deinococcus radiophilus]|uniref:VOC family protein n=1 Tax=Deinococcus radiophilus TaxID=32062 RepID=UPI00361421BD